LLLPDIWKIVTQNIQVSLEGCNDSEHADLLLERYPCDSLFSDINLWGCPGDSIFFAGYQIPVGQTTKLVFTNSDGCDSIVNVSTLPLSASSEFKSIKICPDQTYQFLGVDISVGEQKTFNLLNQYGCDSVITISVQSWPIQEINTTSTPSCPNNGTGVISILADLNSYDGFGFSIDGVNFDTSTVFTDLEAGEYLLIVKDPNECILSKTVNVESIPESSAKLPETIILPCDSSSIIVTTELEDDSREYSYLWWNGSTSREAIIQEPGSIWVEVTDECGVTNKATSSVLLDEKSFQFYIPNIISPSAKSPENSLFKVFPGLDINILSFKLEIYDRWGSLVYQSEQITDSWQGFNNDQELTPGVYVWNITAKVEVCGRETVFRKSGDVTLLR
jgi:hypothetical protein